MANSWSVCGVCDYRHITKSSDVQNVMKGFVKNVKIVIGFQKGFRNHDTVCITEYQKPPNDVLQLARSCDKHNEKYVLFCKKHDCPCCKNCVVESHMECKELTDIDDITRNIKSSNVFADIEQTLSEIAENIKRLRIDREDNLASIGKKSREIEKEVLETRDRINLYLDKLQDAILKDLKTREKEESDKIRRLMKSLIDKENEITEHQKNIGNIKQYASDPSLQDLISAIQTFGDVMTADPCKIPILKHKDKQAQMMVAVTPLTIDSLTPTCCRQLTHSWQLSGGCTRLADCRMVLASLARRLIQVHKPDGSLDIEIGNFGPVFDVTCIGDNSVAVTSGYDKDSLQINSIDLKTRKVTKTLKVNSVNTGVAYNEDELIYCAVKEGIQMINLNGESIVNVTKTKVTDYMYVTTFRDNILYTNCNEDSVTCIDFQGNTRLVFENKSVLKVPGGIYVDGDGKVYVVGSIH